ncbi:DNA-directed RNA polymerases I [Lepidopterella palustris CBS 459.81]|uniref:DNA-directed RNA polymerases I, II, and III subunit RPABC1 n=1 Tax=Lepidopterella palustris CBS 459.81 TaxID=1314670 RepID=A0A8E2EA14_9PEZI|nr:DNA-directed RNA polymerases I [Lepidopterella palustris CBS 459.81]
MDSDRRESPALIRLWRIYKTTKEMCADRGYEMIDEDLEISLAEFKSRFSKESDGEPDRSRMHFSAKPSTLMLAKYTDPPTPKNPDPQPQTGSLWIEFTPDENVGLKQLRDFMQHLVTGNYWSGILICPKPITGMALRLLRGSGGLDEGPPGGVEVFVEQDLLVNITKHELVPKHVLLSKEEKNQLLARYRLKETQLPRIQVTDPVARYLGLRRGQVVKIIRRSETAGRYASYRWAI